MLNIRPSTIYIFIIYLVISYVIWIYKPAIFFSKNGEIRSFGLQEDQTMFYYPLMLVFLALIIFYIFELND